MKYQTYKLVSFDIWGTLIKGNPDFVRARNHLFMSALDNPDYTQVKSIKDATDDYFDTLSEMTGEDYNFVTRIKYMFQQANKPHADIDEPGWESVRKQLHLLALQYPPVIIDEHTPLMLRELREMGIKIAFTSNTGFLHADTMRDTLEKIGLLPFADFTIFSNEIGKAKPHADIFDHLVTISGVERKDILHIGDSVRADYHGAKRNGIDPILYDAKNRYGNRFQSIDSLSQVLDITSGKHPIIYHETMALYSELKLSNGALIDVQNQEFDMNAYSKFKYGDGIQAYEYGHALAKKFINTYPSLFSDKAEIESLVISTSPYKSIVKGSSGIVKGFKSYLNQYLIHIGAKPIVDIVILKTEMFSGDYGTMSEKQRKDLMHTSELFIFEQFIKNKKVILIDDARITGSHESKLVQFLSSKELDRIYFLYVADLDSHTGITQPNIESRMNHAWMNSPEQLIDIMNSETFILNARVCKYILSIQDSAVLLSVLHKLKPHVLYDLLAGIISDGYASMDIYQKNYKILENSANERLLFRPPHHM